jgi:hypothetical protein
MNCSEFDEIWNELLDAETPGRRDLASASQPAEGVMAKREQAASLHALTCHRCRLARTRNETLRQALRGFRPRACPEPDLVDRIVAHVRFPSRRRWNARRAAIPLSAAVAAVLLLALGSVYWRLERFAPRPGQVAESQSASIARPQQVSRPADTPLLSAALADATHATWDLARSTSEPAARLGLEVFDVAAQINDEAEANSDIFPPLAKGGLAGVASAVPRVLADLPQSSPEAAWLQEAGDILAARVRPLSSSARQAFGFLRAPSLGKTETSINLPASKGA